MAFSDLGSLGATGSSGNNQATLALTTSASASAGELVVLVIGDDNIDNFTTSTWPHDGQEVASISDSGSNSWHRAMCNTIGGGSAQGGAALQIWYSILSSNIANGGTITITFTNSTLSDATAVTARHFSFSGTQVAIENVNSLWNSASDPGSLDCVTPNASFLRIRGIAGEVGNNTSLTVTTNWTGWANGNSATSGTTAEICARAEHHISSGTGDASDPTWVSCDNASAYVVFKEVQSTDNPTFVNCGRHKATASVTSISPARPNVRKNGNLLLAFVSLIGAATVSVSGTGWTLIETTNDGTITQAWAWCLISGSEADPSFSWTGSLNAYSIILQYCNSDQSAPIGAHQSATGNSTTIAVSAVTTTRNNSLVMGYLQPVSSDNVPGLPTNYNRKFFLTKLTTPTSSPRVVDEFIATSGTGSDAVSVSITSGAWRGNLIEILARLNTNISPSQSNLTLSQTAPTISQGTGRIASQGNLVLSETAPTVATTSQQIIAPSQGNLTLSQTAPSKTVNENRSPSQADLTLSTTAPAKAVNESRVPSQGNLILSPVAPAIATSDNKSVAPLQGDLVLSQTVPTRTINVNRNPAHGDLTLSLTAPASITNVNRSPSQGNIVLSFTSPNVSENIVLTPAQGDLSLSETAPLKTISINRVPAQGDMVLSETAPAIGRTDNQFRTPPQGNLALTQTSPTITSAGEIVPASAEIILSTAQPIVEATDHQFLSPSHSDLELSTTAPALLYTDNKFIIPIQGNIFLSATNPILQQTGLVSICQLNAMMAAKMDIDVAATESMDTGIGISEGDLNAIIAADSMNCKISSGSISVRIGCH